MRRSWATASAMLAVALGVALGLTLGGTVAAAPQPVLTSSAIGGSPPMGWSSWSYLRNHPTAAGVEAQARALRSSGLAAAGYRYVNVDDYWMACDANGPEVDSHGRWMPDPAAFPAGIAAVARYVHAKGLRFGIYLTPGIPANAVRLNTPIEGTADTARQIARTSVTEDNYSCGHMYGIDYSRAGASAYIDSWADELASWGVDFVKLDGVGSWDVADVRAWSAALRQTGRPILLELSNALAISQAPRWAALADGWRTTPDIECHSCERGGSSYPLTDWALVASRFDAVASWQPYGGSHGWNDEDSVEIGNGDADGLTVPERQTVLSLWSLASAPLILGADLTALTPADTALLENRAVIRVDQDGIAARRVVDSGSEQVFAKRQPDGVWYIGVFNTDPAATQTFQISLAGLGLHRPIRATDLWTGRSLGVMTGSYTITVAPGAVSLISARLLPGVSGHASWSAPVSR